MDKTDTMNANTANSKTLECILKEKLEYYKEENSKMESYFKKLKLMDDVNNTESEISKLLNRLDKIVQETECDDLCPTTIALTQAHKLRKQNNYVSKLKVCIKLYTNLNVNLAKEIKSMKMQLEESNKNVSNIPTLTKSDVAQLEEKAKRYENVLEKLEKNYPWLNDPAFDLPSITKEIETLKKLRAVKMNLTAELNAYKGLKPNMQEAAQQLVDVKHEHQLVHSKLLDDAGDH